MASDQTISALDAEDLKTLGTMRAWVLGHYDDETQAATVEGKLHLIDQILKEKWIAPHETGKLQALGVVFGDAMAQELGLEWKMLEDEEGRDFTLVVPKTTIKIFPVTMISKRIEDGEEVDVVYLFGDACGHVTGLARQLKA